MIDRVMTQCRACGRWWSAHPDDLRIGNVATCTCGGELVRVDMKAHIALLSDGVMRDRMADKIHKVPRSKYPMTILLLSGKDNSVVFRHVLEAPKDKELHQVTVPTFAGTEHYPVRARIEYADSTVEEHGMV